MQEIDNSGARRPVVDAKLNASSLLCGWLETEGDAEIYSVKELQEKLKSIMEIMYILRILEAVERRWPALEIWLILS